MSRPSRAPGAKKALLMNVSRSMNKFETECMSSSSDSDISKDNEDELLSVCSLPAIHSDIHDINMISSDSELSEQSTEESTLLVSENEKALGNRNFQEVHSNSNINEQLCQWSIKNNISHSALHGLLNILKPHFSSLPSDPRTLLSTPRSIIPKRVIAPGQYHHLGLEKCLRYLVQKNKVQESVCNILVNIDGLPLSKSSSSELYPILVSLFTHPNVVGLVGLYHGYKKPEDLNLFLEDFVEEVSQLVNSGFSVNGADYSVKLKGFVCDAPAKAFIKGIKHHTGSFSCTKCEQEGEFINNRMCFPDIHSKVRTDNAFRTRINEEHHRENSILENIPEFDMITGFPLDYMHLICLGVMKKLVGIWCNGPPPHKLSSHQLQELSVSLVSQSRNIPIEFCRKPRTLNEYKRWKATEFRQFLFYTGPVVLKAHLPRDNYLNFLSLHVALSILANSKSTVQQIDYAHSLLIYFVQTFIILYGKYLVSHNVHNLLHLTNDVKLFGNLDSFGAFQFENFMQIFLKYTRKPDNPISQIVKRFQEAMNANENVLKPKIIVHGPAKEHSEGPLIENCNPPQYSEYRCPTFCIQITHPNNCFGLNDGSIIVVRNIATKNKNLMVIGQKYKNSQDFYKQPCSSHIGIFEISNVGELECWPLEDVSVKYVKLSLPSSHVVIPLLHCEK